TPGQHYLRRLLRAGEPRGASLERQFTPVERPTVNNPPATPGGTSRGSCPSWITAALATKQPRRRMTVQPTDDDRRGGHAMQQGPSPRREAARPRRQRSWVTRWQRRRPPSPIDRRTPSGRLLPY